MTETWANCWEFIVYNVTMGMGLFGAFFWFSVFVGFQVRQGRNALKGKVSSSD